MDQETRILLGWMDQDEAVPLLLGHLPAVGEDISAQVAAWRAASAAVQGRGRYTLPTPTLDPLPNELREMGETFRQRADVMGLFAAYDWTVGVADLRKVLSFQKLVISDDARSRVSSANAEDLQSLFSLCLPGPAAQSNFSAVLDEDKKGLAIASQNPNLRVQGFGQFVVEGQPILGFTIGAGTSFVQIVQYQDRWFIRDGYHRCYGLIARGIYNIPCLFIRARNAQEFGGNDPRFLRWEIIFGDRPPFLKDLLDDSVAATARRAATRKVIYITAREFNVQI